MSFYVFTTDQGIHYRHDTDPLSLTILNDKMKPQSAVFQPVNDEYDSAESFQSGLLAMTYWRDEDVQLFDLKTGILRKTLPFRKINSPRFDETGKRLFCKLNYACCLLDVKTGDVTPIRGLSAIDRCVPIKNNALLIPSQKKGELLRVSLTDGKVASLPVAIDATFFDLKRNPASGDVILIDRKKGVHCVDPASGKILWSVSLKKELGKDHLGVGYFCGNGKLFAGAVSSRTDNYGLILDAHTGNLLPRSSMVGDVIPWKDEWVRNKETRKDSYLSIATNLSTGEKIEVDLAAQ